MKRFPPTILFVFIFHSFLFFSFCEHGSRWTKNPHRRNDDRVTHAVRGRPSSCSWWSVSSSDSRGLWLQSTERLDCVYQSLHPNLGFRRLRNFPFTVFIYTLSKRDRLDLNGTLKTKSNLNSSCLLSTDERLRVDLSLIVPMYTPRTFEHVW